MITAAGSSISTEHMGFWLWYLVFGVLCVRALHPSICMTMVQSQFRCNLLFHIKAKAFFYQANNGLWCLQALAVFYEPDKE